MKWEYGELDAREVLNRALLNFEAEVEEAQTGEEV